MIKDVDFTDAFRVHLAKKRLSYSGFAELVHVTSGFVGQLATKRCKPPLDRIEQWADALDLTGPERERFIYLARLEHCPPEIRAQFLKAEAADTATIGRIVDAHDGTIAGQMAAAQAAQSKVARIESERQQAAARIIEEQAARKAAEQAAARIADQEATIRELTRQLEAERKARAEAEHTLAKRTTHRPDKRRTG